MGNSESPLARLTVALPIPISCTIARSEPRTNPYSRQVCSPHSHRNNRTILPVRTSNKLVSWLTTLLHLPQRRILGFGWFSDMGSPQIGREHVALSVIDKSRGRIDDDSNAHT
jgi:hypothetical protein